MQGISGSVRRSCQRELGAQAHAALQCYGLTGHELEVGRCELNAWATDLGLNIAVVAHRRHVNVRLERIGVSFSEILELCSPGERADNVHIDVIGTPFISCNARKTTNSFFCGSIGALSNVAEESRSRGEVDNGALGLFQVRIACLHVVERSIEAGIDRQVELIGRVFSKGNARSRSLRVVDEHINATEFFNGLIDDILYGCSIVVASAHVCLDREHFDAVETFELFFRIFKLLNVKPCDG